MAERGSSGPEAPEPENEDSHAARNRPASGGRGAARPKGGAEAKRKGRGKTPSEKGKGSSPAKGKKAGKGKGAEAPARGGTEPKASTKRRSASSQEYSRRRAGKRQREAGQFFRWSKEPSLPAAAKNPPPPPPPRRAAAPPTEASPSEESDAQPLRLRSRSPTAPRDTRRPAEPVGAPKARGSGSPKAKQAVVTDQAEEESSSSSSSSSESSTTSAAAEAEGSSRPGPAPADPAPAAAVPKRAEGTDRDPPNPPTAGAEEAPPLEAAGGALGKVALPRPRVKEESSDSCFEPVRLVQAEDIQERRALPVPDYSTPMIFTVQLRHSRKQPCSSRYLPEVAVEYTSQGHSAEPARVIQCDLHVLGLGGSRVVVRSPANPTLAWKFSREDQDMEKSMFMAMGCWTPGRVQALGVHSVIEVGQGSAVYYASVIEMELCSPCPEITPRVIFEMLLTISHASKMAHLRDLGRKNIGSRRKDTGLMGDPPKDEIVLIDGNYWLKWRMGENPRFPNKRRAQGFWSTLHHFAPEQLQAKIEAVIQRFQNDLESLCKAVFRLMHESLGQAEILEACENLVSTQVLGYSPDGQLCQYVLADAVAHSLEPGHQWRMVPIRNLSKAKAGTKAGAGSSTDRP